jgi:LRR receptor-like serine/threonine-protein kinase FLS2
MIVIIVHIVTGAIPREIGNLQNLEIFSIALNNFSGPIPFEIFNISTIREIAMTLNNLTGHLSSNVGFFLPNLQGLYLGGNKLSGTIPNSSHFYRTGRKLILGLNS